MGTLVTTCMHKCEQAIHTGPVNEYLTLASILTLSSSSSLVSIITIPCLLAHPLFPSGLKIPPFTHTSKMRKMSAKISCMWFHIMCMHSFTYFQGKSVPQSVTYLQTLHTMTLALPFILLHTLFALLQAQNTVFRRLLREFRNTQGSSDCTWTDTATNCTHAVYHN